MATSNPYTSGSAPASGLAVPASAAAYAPDLLAQQTQLNRQQAIAQYLMQKGLEPQGKTEMVSGWAIPNSQLSGLSGVASALGGRYMQNQVDDKQMALAAALQQARMSGFDAMSGGGAQPQAPQATPQASNPTTQALPADGSALPVSVPDPSAQVPQQATPQAAPQAAPQPTPLSQVDRIRQQARAAFLMGNTDLANKLIENISTLTVNQRDMSAMGQDPLLMGQLGTAEARKKGMIEMQPGTTTVDLNTGAQRFQPKVGEGINLNATGQASAVPGYAEANALINGTNAGAVSAAQAGNEMVTVNTPQGPVMMTKAQAVQQAGGAQQRAPQAAPQGDPMRSFKPDTQAPAPTPYGPSSDQTAILQQELAKETNPANRAALQRELSRVTPSSVPGTLQMPAGQATPAILGIPLQDEGTSAMNTKLGAQGASDLLGSREKARSANDELASINESRTAIANGAYQGFGADTKTDAVKIGNAFGIKLDSGQAANTDYLRSTLGKGLLDSAKTLGTNPSNADAARIDAIVGTIGKDPQAMNKILDWREGMAKKVINQHNADVQSAVKNGASMPYDLSVSPNLPRTAAPTTPAVPGGGFKIIGVR